MMFASRSLCPLEHALEEGVVRGFRASLRECRELLVPRAPAAGLLGIGGALIFNPFLLAMGVQPQVAASTAVRVRHSPGPRLKPAA